MSVQAFVGAGSNLDDPEHQIKTALNALDQLPHTRLVAQSHWYRSAPWGGIDQPEFVNVVAEIETALDAEQLLEELLAIERRHGRMRRVRWGPRTLDLDLLLFGDAQIRTPRLKVPHPRLHERNFVLVPLADLVVDLILPDGKRLSTLVANCAPHRLIRIAEPPP